MTTKKRSSITPVAATGALKKRGQGEGNVYKREDGWMVGRISLGVGADGKRKRKVIYGPPGTSVEEMRRRLRALLHQIDSGQAVPTGKDTVAAFLDRWLELIRTDGSRAPRTVEHYAQVIEAYIKPALGHIKLARLSAADVQAFLSARQPRARNGTHGRTAERISPATMKQNQAILRAALKQAKRWKLITENVASAEHVDAPKVVRKEARYLSAEEVSRLLPALEGHRLRPLFVTMLANGLRPSEAYGLTWERVDLVAGVLRLRESLERDPDTREWRLGAMKTEKSKRDLPLPGPALDALREHRLAQNRERLFYAKQWATAPIPDLVFTTRGGRPLDGNHVRDALAAVLENAGIEHATPYSLRHSWASLALLEGVPLRVIAEGLGHTGVQLAATTYAHVAPELHRATAEKIGRLLAPK